MMVVEDKHCSLCDDTGLSGPCQLCPECLGTSKRILSRPDRERKVPKFTQDELDYLDEMFERRIADPRA